MKRYWFKWILLVIAILVVGTWALSTTRKTEEQPSSQEPTEVNWVQERDGSWKAKGTPPACPTPLEFASIADVQQATSVLYPGQLRSVGYEPTAGFRFDRVANDAVTVRAPMDGRIIQAARFTVGGEIQYVFDVLSPCGIMHRFDHLLVLPPKLQELADKLPPPKENDNRSTRVSPPFQIERGEVIATAVGLTKNNNTFISWTVFDFRQKNKISQNKAWAQEHPLLDHYAICPFVYLPEEDLARIKTLPAADFMSGSKSDFCDKL